MKQKFFEYFEGYFNNQRQAFNYPTKFAMIELTHLRLDENRFKVSQKYVTDTETYRKTIIEIIEDQNTLVIKNYKDEKYLPGCDIKFEYINENFYGKNICNECYIQYGSADTYIMTESILGNGYYHVIDRGYDVNTNEQIWGSYDGFFEFDRK